MGGLPLIMVSGEVPRLAEGLGGVLVGGAQMATLWESGALLIPEVVVGLSAQK